MITPPTTGSEVIEHFAVTGTARRALEHWQQARPEVAQVVLNHVTRVPYTTTSDTLRAVAARTEHALGDVTKREVKRVTSIRDWNPRFAMTHVLHYALEQIGEPFTYQQFRDFTRDDPQARAMLTFPSLEAVSAAAKQVSPRLAKDAMRWRIGNSYYSFLREMITVAGLREQGIDLRVHPLADALFRADAWTGSTVVSLYIGNAAFRDGAAGRKPRPDQLLGGAFRYVPVKLRTQHTFGRLHVPSDSALRDAAAHIRQQNRGPRAHPPELRKPF